MREIAPDHEAHWFEIYGHVASTGEPVRFVNEAKALEGRWFDVYAFRLGDRESRRVAILFNDITERKRAEEALRESEDRLRRAMEIETVGVIFFRTDGSITDANDAFLRMSGYNREDLAEGLVRWDEMTPPEWMPHSLKAIEEFKSTGRIPPYEKEYIRKDGSRWWALFAATRLGEEEGVEFIVDVTGRKMAEEERERLIVHELTARAQAEERRRLSRELHDRVAHDIALVHQSLELHEALKTSDPKRAVAKMQLARRIVKEALESIRNLSMELREPEVRRGLEAALANLLRDLVPPTIESSLSVEGDEAPVPPEIRSQLSLILREAIRNAVMHSGAAHIAVEVDTAQERVVCRVEDDESGFDPDEVRTAGTGGLRAMSERATLVGGTLDLSSVPGRGTTIQVSVPLGGA
jgi:PAS domain S-box-containing protein